MAETYCGKRCAECERREMLNCLGCKAGPGRQFGGDCELAKCCRNKGHQECNTCGFNRNCGTLRRKDRMPEYRQKSIEEEKAREEAVAQRAPVLGKWLWILFWLIIPSSVAAFLTNENIARVLPATFVPGQVLRAICAFAYGLILIRLTAQEERYLTAGICTLVCSAASILLACVSQGSETPAWSFLISIPAAIVSLVGEYNEFTAHAVVLTWASDELSEKWSTLWKWYIGMYGAMLASLLLMLVSPVLGALVAVASAIGVLVVSVLKLVYLYRTAKLFREYSLSGI